MHVIGTNGIHGNGGDEGGINPAGEPDDDVRKTVLDEVVASPEHDGPVHLLVRVQGGGNGWGWQRRLVGGRPYVGCFDFFRVSNRHRE